MGVEVFKKAHRVAVIALALASPTYVLPLRAQQRAPSTGYEAASFRPSRSGDPRRPGFEFLPGGRFRSTNSPLLPVIAAAYNIPWQSMESVRLRIKGLPDWMLTDRYDLEVTAEKATAELGASPQTRTRNEQTRLMLQAVLEDRLKLQIRGAKAEFVSAGAKIPIVPFENSPAPRAGGVNRPNLWKQRRADICSEGKTWKRSTNSSGKV
jgi:Protein of unknown function (DUF3738)